MASKSPSLLIFKEALDVLTKMSQDESVAIIDRIGLTLLEQIRNKKTIFIAGNGGSWADADHFAGELRAQFEKKGRRALPALALPISLSTLTAWGNDYTDGFESAMRRDLEAMGRPGDVLIAISTSGKAKNVRLALQEAKRQNMVTIAISGNGSESKTFSELAQYHIVIPHSSTARVQEAYQIIVHILCSYIDTIDSHAST